jgi:hypothetical protein
VQHAAARIQAELIVHGLDGGVAAFHAHAGRVELAVLLHARLRAPVGERIRRGIDRLDLQPIGREQRPGDGERVVDLVGGVGVDHHAQAARARLEALVVPGIVALQGSGHVGILVDPAL